MAVEDLMFSASAVEQLRGIRLCIVFPWAVDQRIKARFAKLSTSPVACVRLGVIRSVCPKPSMQLRLPWKKTKGCHDYIRMDRFLHKVTAAVPAPEDLAMVMENLEDPSRVVRFESIGVMVRLLTGTSCPQLRSVVGAFKTAVKAALLARLRDKDHCVRARALCALDKFGYVEEPDVLSAVVSRTAQTHCHRDSEIVSHTARHVLRIGTLGCARRLIEEGDGIDSDYFEDRCGIAAEESDPSLFDRGHGLQRPTIDKKVNLTPKVSPSWTRYVSEEHLNNARAMVAADREVPVELVEYGLLDPLKLQVPKDHKLVAVDARALGVEPFHRSGMLKRFGATRTAAAFCRGADLFKSCIATRKLRVRPTINHSDLTKTIQELKRLGKLEPMPLGWGDFEDADVSSDECKAFPVGWTFGGASTDISSDREERVDISYRRYFY